MVVYGCCRQVAIGHYQIIDVRKLFGIDNQLAQAVYRRALQREHFASGDVVAVARRPQIGIDRKPQWNNHVAAQFVQGKWRKQAVHERVQLHDHSNSQQPGSAVLEGADIALRSLRAKHAALVRRRAELFYGRVDRGAAFFQSQRRGGSAIIRQRFKFRIAIRAEASGVAGRPAQVAAKIGERAVAIHAAGGVGHNGVFHEQRSGLPLLYGNGADIAAIPGGGDSARDGVIVEQRGSAAVAAHVDISADGSGASVGVEGAVGHHGDKRLIVDSATGSQAWTVVCAAGDLVVVEGAVVDDQQPAIPLRASEDPAAADGAVAVKCAVGNGRVVIVEDTSAQPSRVKSAGERRRVVLKGAVDHRQVVVVVNTSAIAASIHLTGGRGVAAKGAVDDVERSVVEHSAAVAVADEPVGHGDLLQVQRALRVDDEKLHFSATADGDVAAPSIDGGVRGNGDGSAQHANRPAAAEGYRAAAKERRFQTRFIADSDHASGTRRLRARHGERKERYQEYEALCVELELKKFANGHDLDPLLCVEFHRGLLRVDRTCSWAEGRKIAPLYASGAGAAHCENFFTKLLRPLFPILDR